ncbi:coiled-coil domain-containing protein 22, partial [Biomphalaria glabrata]
NFEQLISTVEDTGVVMREIKDLEEQVEIESNKKVLSNLEKISVDLQQMKKENATLLAKVKGK